MKRANRDRVTAVAALAAVGCAGTMLSGGGTPSFHAGQQNNDVASSAATPASPTSNSLVRGGEQVVGSAANNDILSPRHLQQDENTEEDQEEAAAGNDINTPTSDSSTNEERELKGEYVLTATINNYPDLSEIYTDSGVEPRGTIEFIFHGKSFMARANLSGLEADCVNCGIHIHEGKSCDTYDAVGDHYWRHDDPAFETNGDPWQIESGVRRAVYTSDGVGNTLPGHHFSLYSGYGFEMNEGHAVVVHARDGTRIGCGVLQHINEFEKKDSSNPNEKPADNAASVANAANTGATPAAQR